MSDFTDFLIDGPEPRRSKKPKKARKCDNFETCGKHVSGWTDDRLCHWCRASFQAAIELALQPKLGYIEADEIARGMKELGKRGYTGMMDMFLCRMVGRFGFDRVKAGAIRVQNKRLMELLEI